jgi:4'-phosphopantetheinyl transferase
VNNNIYLYHANLQQPEHLVTEFYQKLAIDEQQRADRFYFAKHRNRFIIARFMLRKLLAKHLKCNITQIKFSQNKYGKPQLANLEFSLSHSGDKAIYAIGYNHPIGIDIEKHKDMDFLGLANRFFSKQEYHELIKQADIKEHFFRIWTQKEAIIKALGYGLHYDLKSFSVNVGIEAGIKHINTNENWQIKFIQIASAYTAAIAFGLNNQLIPIEFI